MEKVEDAGKVASCNAAGKLPVSVIIAARNEAKNLSRCLQALRDFGEVYVNDSQSTDETVEIARSHGA
ncbi:MAG: glycosyltransferase, partial [Candidatus Sulfotelmatobacter sp.]